MRARLLLWSTSCCLLIAILEQASWGEPLTQQRFTELLTELQPKATEAWRTIPWKTAVLDAQRTAAAENKPIFIWAMDGHPLGCT